MEYIIDEIAQYDAIFQCCDNDFKYDKLYVIYYKYDNEQIITVRSGKESKRHYDIMSNKNNVKLRFKIIGFVPMQTKIYEIKNECGIKKINDIFYNFVNSTMQIKQLYIYLYASRENNGTCMYIISLNIDGTKNHYNFPKYLTKTKTISNLNKLYLFYDAINEHDNSTYIQVSFEQN
jgi:hypothetical protein